MCEIMIASKYLRAGWQRSYKQRTYLGVVWPLVLGSDEASPFAGLAAWFCDGSACHVSAQIKHRQVDYQYEYLARHISVANRFALEHSRLQVLRNVVIT